MDIDVNLLDRLEQEHRDVEAIFARMESATDESEQRSLVQDLETALAPHMAIEESEVYPALGQLDDDMAEQAQTEHGEARDGLEELKAQVGQAGFSAALQTLKSGIEHHVEEEEGEAFPMLRRSAAGG
jgi:iron-sulfur cluster repair protein YtfE (RIC family)